MSEEQEQKQPTTKKKTNYLNNKDLLAEVLKSKEQGFMTQKLATMLQLLTTKYAKKGNFSGYTYNEDMQAYAMLMLVKTWDSFDPNKSSNPFAFFTQCIKNSFIQYLNQEKNQRNIRDQKLVDAGMLPSFTYQMEHESDNERIYVEDEEDYDEQRRIAEHINKSTENNEDTTQQ